MEEREMHNLSFAYLMCLTMLLRLDNQLQNVYFIFIFLSCQLVPYHFGLIGEKFMQIWFILLVAIFLCS